MKSVAHFVATPLFLLLPFHSFQTLTLCKIHDNCPSCVSLNLAATTSLFTAVWHWTLCLENMCVWKWERKGRESDPFPLGKTLAAFIWAHWVNVASVTDQESKAGDLQILRKSEVTPATWKDFSDEYQKSHHSSVLVETTILLMYLPTLWSVHGG